MRSVYEKVGLYIEDRPTDDRQPHIWENFKWRYLRGGSSDLLRVWFYDGVFGVSGLNGANSGLTKFNRYVEENNARRIITLRKVFLVHTYIFAQKCLAPKVDLAHMLMINLRFVARIASDR